MSNMYAMNLARYKYCPDIKEKGLSGLPRLILFTSAEVKKLFLISDTDFLRMHYLRGFGVFGASDMLLSYPCVTNMPKSNIIFSSKGNSDGFDIVTPGHSVLYVTLI